MNDKLINGFQQFFGVTPIDRTGTMTGVIDTDTTNPIPAFVTSSISIDDLITQRGEEIKAMGKDIYLLWSGGIDSTTAFYALVRTGASFTVIMDDDSAKEYPMLSNQIQSGSVYPQVKVMLNKSLSTIDVTKSIMVTGEIGDQISGSMKFINFDAAQRSAVYTENIPALIYTNLDPVVSKVLGDISKFTTAEYLWALNFIFKYTHVVDRMNNLVALHGFEFVHFFNTDPFQIWALNNYHQFCNFGSFYDYKKQLKQYIFSINGDDMYFKFKTKVPSLKNTSFVAQGKI